MDYGLAPFGAPRNDEERDSRSPSPALQARVQRDAEKRGGPEDEAEQEGPDARAARLFRLLRRLGLGPHDHRVLALDHAAGDVIRHRIDDYRGVVRLGEHDTAEAGVLNEAVHPLVAAHHDVDDDVNPQPRRVAMADAAVE